MHDKPEIIKAPEGCLLREFWHQALMPSILVFLEIAGFNFGDARF
jgi:ABC-type dipeptide/oligopeptide/nickel transport system permease subunit